MAIKLEIVSVQGTEVEDGAPAFLVECCDEYCAEVKLTSNVFTAESWKKTSESILKAIEMLELNQ